MPLQLEANLELPIGALMYRVAEHPAAPGQPCPYGQEGRAATVYQLLDPRGSPVALKVFKPRYRLPALVSLADQMASFARLPGLQVCQRTILTPQRHADLLSEHPDLTYAVLMPWIDGPAWMQVLMEQTVLTPQQSLGLAESLAGILVSMEQHGLAHCDLSGPNVLLPELANGEGVILVDVEGMYGPGLQRPRDVLGTSPGYGHRSAQEGEGIWGAGADRFAGALLLAEMLGWCDPRVRDAAAGDPGYFAADEVQQPSARYDTLVAALRERWGTDIARLLERAWNSETLWDCPTFGEWLVALPESPGTTAGVSQDGLKAGEHTRALVQRALELEALGNLAGAVVAYRQAITLLPAQHPLTGELSSIVRGLDSQGGAKAAAEQAVTLQYRADVEDEGEVSPEPLRTGRQLMPEPTVVASETASVGPRWVSEVPEPRRSSMSWGRALGAFAVVGFLIACGLTVAAFLQGELRLPGPPAIDTIDTWAVSGLPSPEAAALPTATRWWRRTPEPTALSTTTEEPTVAPVSVVLSAGATVVREIDGMTMVFVPAGTFAMGSTEDGWPRVHDVTLDAFWLDQTEVTNAQYAQCVAAGTCESSAYSGDRLWNGETYPVVGASWDDAAAYCAWAGSRLPTEAEWEYAARGPESRVYPWGDDQRQGRANISERAGADGFDYTAPVGSFPEGASWVGALDMVGNVWEWVNDWYDEYHYVDESPSSNPPGPESGTYRVLRGGYWDSYWGEDILVRPRGTDPDSRPTTTGFRCVVDIQTDSVVGTASPTAVGRYEAISSVNASLLVELNRTTIDGVVIQAAFSPHGEALIVASTERSGELLVLDVNDMQNRERFVPQTSPGGWPQRFALSPVDDVIALGLSSKIIWLGSTVDARRLQGLMGHTKEISALAFSGDGETLGSASRDRTVRLWRVSDGALLGTLDHVWLEYGVGGVALSPDSTLVLTYGGAISLWQADGGQLLWRSDVGNPRCTTVSTDFGEVAAHTEEGVVLWYLYRSGLSEPRTLQDPGGMNCMIGQFSPNGQLWGAGTFEGEIRLWDTSSGALITTLGPHEDAIRAVAFSPDGSLLATASQDGDIRLWGVITH